MICIGLIHLIMEADIWSVSKKHWTDIYLSHHSYWRFDWFWTLFLKQHNCILPDIVLVSCFPNSERSWSCVLSVLKHRTDGNISCQQLNNWHETWTLQINTLKYALHIQWGPKDETFQTVHYFYVTNECHWSDGQMVLDLKSCWRHFFTRFVMLIIQSGKKPH